MPDPVDPRRDPRVVGESPPMAHPDPRFTTPPQGPRPGWAGSDPAGWGVRRYEDQAAVAQEREQVAVAGVESEAALAAAEQESAAAAAAQQVAAEAAVNAAAPWAINQPLELTDPNTGITAVFGAHADSSNTVFLRITVPGYDTPGEPPTVVPAKTTTFLFTRGAGLIQTLPS